MAGVSFEKLLLLDLTDDAIRQQAITWSSADQDMSLGHNEFM